MRNVVVPSEVWQGRPRDAGGPSAPPLPRYQGVKDDTSWLLLAGFATVLMLVVGLGGWAATFSIAGAVQAEGTVVVASSVKKVQHPSGGVVREIFVHDGSKVAKDDMLMRLDDTTAKANLGIMVGQLQQLAVRKARLIAERDGQGSFDVNAITGTGPISPDLQEVINNERALFRSRQVARLGQKSLLEERITQLTDQIQGLMAQSVAKAKETDAIQRELGAVMHLSDSKLVPISRLTQMQREAAQSEGETAQVTANIAETKGKIAETRLQIIQIDKESQSEVLKDLRDLEGKEDELRERRVAAEDLLKRTDIRSPQDGTVHELMVHTVGGVVNASEPIMLIVPNDDQLVIEAKLSPRDIEQVHAGQTTLIRFPAFDLRTTPEVVGTVERIGADLTKDTANSPPYYALRVDLAGDEVKKLGKHELLPGMPAEIQIKSQERTVLSYLIKPLRDQISQVFIER